MSDPPRPREDEDALVRQGLAVLEVVARRVERRLGGLVQVDDLLAAGRVAVLQVVRAWDPSRARFAPYCALRLQWALLDMARRETHGRVVGRARAIAASERFAEGAAADAAERGQVALDEDPEARLTALLSGHAAALALPLLVAGASDDKPDEGPTPEDRYRVAEFAERIRAVVGQLPARERTLVERHYWRDEPLEHIAKDLGVSKSWASRLHAQAIEKLAREIAKL
ncbi:MAG TPA: sigma-70 family RNA polymerase sigma factor [Byssovorax sp.]